MPRKKNPYLIAGATAQWWLDRFFGTYYPKEWTFHRIQDGRLVYTSDTTTWTAHPTTSEVHMPPPPGTHTIASLKQKNILPNLTHGLDPVAITFRLVNVVNHIEEVWMGTLQALRDKAAQDEREIEAAKARIIFTVEYTDDKTKLPCPRCGATLEVWEDGARAICRSCLIHLEWAVQHRWVNGRITESRS